MLQVRDTIISDDVRRVMFVCDIAKCKGACCVEGDGGAPLEHEELQLLDENVQNILPFLPEKGKKAIAEKGNYLKDEDGDWVTPLVENKECAYTVFNEEGAALCGIELAHKAGQSTFLKPISCHLYPIRLTKYTSFTAVNYHHWDICNPARSCGASLNVKVYEFLKTPLIRKFGKDWYDELTIADEYMAKQKD